MLLSGTGEALLMRPDTMSDRTQVQRMLPSTRKHFGTFDVDLESGELRRNGLKLKLQEKPFQMLAILLERPGEVVTRLRVQYDGIT
jgi:DNA-binding response OmpR family regulator